MRHALARLCPLVLGLVLAVGSTVAPAAHAHPEGLHALVFSKTAAGAYRHASIPAGIAMFEELAAERGWEITATEDSSVFNDTDLASFDVVVLLQTSGMVWDSDAQRAAFRDYLHTGGGVVAIHNAVDMNIEDRFPWWDETLGMTMTGHSAVVRGTAKVADHTHPSGGPLPHRWTRNEEWYNFDHSARGDVHVLVTADETTYDPGPHRMGHDHPISWCRDVDGGRVWATAMGHEASTYSEPLFRAHVAGGVESAAGQVAADCGPTDWGSYEKVPLDTGTRAPGTLDIAPDGRVFFTEYGGRLKVYDPERRYSVTAGTLPVYTGGEDGLTGLALDPDFATNGWLYLAYAPLDPAPGEVIPGGAHVRISRFTMTGDTLDPASEKVLLRVPGWREQEPGHTGGALAFGPDGDLFIGTGDDVNPFHSDGYTPIDERPGRALFDAQGTAANTDDLRGKILRITPTPDGSYTVPSGNLFPEGTAKTRPEIYAMGFRNAFRFTVHPTTGVIYAADYGPDAGADSADRGPGALVEWNIIDEPGNYGWPYCVGRGVPYNDYDFATKRSGPKFDCARPVNTSPNNTGLTELPPSKDAEVWYGQGAHGRAFPELGSGGEAPMAFPVYRYDPDNSSEIKFPPYFHDTPFFGEWSRNALFEFRLDGSGHLHKVNGFLSDSDFRSPMDMRFGPDGAMYLLEWGTGFGRNNPDSGLYRIEYSGGDRRPVVRMTATPDSGAGPLTVRFSSEGTADPEGGRITYSWDFGDGNPASDRPDPEHTFTDNGVYNVQLTATDPQGNTGVANKTVTVGNTRPEVHFTRPVNGGMFGFGDTVPFAAGGHDAEDGVLDCADITVTPVLGHDSHGHDTPPVHRCSGAFVAEADTAHQELNTYYVAKAEYTDRGAPGLPALSAEEQVILQPKHKQAEFHDRSRGVRIVPHTGAESGARIGDISDGDWVSYRPVNLTGIERVSFRVSSPAGGGTIELRAGSPDGRLLASRSVPATGGWDRYTNLPAVPVADPGSTFELFMVFRTRQNHAFDVDSVTYVGDGVGEPARRSGRLVGIGGMCVDADAHGTANGTKVQLWQCNGGANQTWDVVDGTVRSLGKCMNVHGGSVDDGAVVELWDCNGSPAQRWSLEPDGALRNGSKCLDAAGGGSEAGTRLLIWSCHGGPNQRWALA
ncbi:ThuA domain-containing protein [Streptomyces sp. NPDC090029]|uniref:ThuA domain-containing protein n=1 Tax=Streptomyces sp. NPDC090029 TaxID=3365924 RepID=UPI00380392CE